MPPQNNPQTLTTNPKFRETVKTFVIYGMIISVVNALVSLVVAALSWSRYSYGLGAGGLIGAIIGGIIGGIIAGILCFYFYEPVHNWVKRNNFLSKHIHDMFTLFWKPYIVVTAIIALFGLLGILSMGAATVAITAGYAAIGAGTLLIGWAVSLVVNVAVFYWYAKQISAKLSPLYPW